ncbi:MAG: OmpA family protein [Bacteroidota bacterium]
MKLHKFLILSCILLFSFSFNLRAQKARMYSANVLYDTTAFAEAIPKYQKVLKKDSTNIEAMLKLADCYRFTNDIQNAVITYKKIVDKKIGQPIDVLFYAQALMSAGNYDEAKKYMAMYNADLRGETFTKAMEDMNRFFKDSANFAIETQPFNSKFNDFSPRLLNKKIVFASSRKRSRMANYINTWTDNNYFNLFYTRKKGNGKYTCVRAFVHSLDNRYNAGPVSFSRQSNTVYLTRNNIVDTKLVKAIDGQVKLQLYAATLNKKGTAYQYLLEFQYNNKEYNFMHPAISDDGLRFYFVSDMPGGFGGFDLWMCTKENDKWSVPKNLGKDVNTIGDEVFPYVKGSMLYFSSNGLEGIGGLDIFKVSLDDSGIPGATPDNMGIPINSSGDDFGIVYTEEGDKGYFSSNRKALNMDDDIYSFTNKVPEKREIKIAGIISEKILDTPLADAKVFLLNNKNEVIAEVSSDANGKFSFAAEPYLDYSVKATKRDYVEAVQVVNTTTGEKTKVFVVDLKLDKDLGTMLNILVIDSRSNQPIKDVKIEIVDKDNSNKTDFLTSDAGNYSTLLTDKKTGDIINYAVKFSKDGYYNANTVYTYNIKNKDTVLIKQRMDKIQDIEPVYFDYDKFNIRPDAAKKLDQLAELLTENPKWNIQLLSHTDCRGTAAYNEVLSEKRARSTKDYLIGKGISTKRITGKGYGTTRMVVKCDCSGGGNVSDCTEAQHQLNRRTEFVIIKN